MNCNTCQSADWREFTAEINIHFPKMKGIDIPTVWVFPTISVCMSCGTAQFRIPEAERERLADRDYRDVVDGTAA
jgi:hypothetical protein